MTKTTLTTFAALLAGALTLAPNATALPLTVTSATNVTFDLNGFDGNGTIDGLSSQVTLSGFVFANEGGNTRVDFNFSIYNNSSAPVNASRVSTLAFNTSPNLLTTPAASVGGNLFTVVNTGNQPNVGTVEFCFTTVNCAGGGSGGVTMGNTGSDSASIYFAGSITQFDIDQLSVRYQAVACVDGTTSNCPGSASGLVEEGGDVPEPSAWLLMGGGMALLGVIRRARA